MCYIMAISIIDIITIILGIVSGALGMLLLIYVINEILHPRD